MEWVKYLNEFDVTNRDSKFLTLDEDGRIDICEFSKGCFYRHLPFSNCQEYFDPEYFCEIVLPGQMKIRSIEECEKDGI